MEGEVKDGRKIQFSVPSASSTQLDPRQVEMIRRRRPTPATLFCTTDHPSPDEESSNLPLFLCENGNLKPKKLETFTYQPPSLTAVQKMAESHIRFQKVVQDSPSPESSDDEDSSPGMARDPDAVTSDRSDHSAFVCSADEDEDKEQSKNKTDERGENNPSNRAKPVKLEV